MSLRFKLSAPSFAILGLVLAAGATTASATTVITAGTTVTPTAGTIGTITAANTVASASGPITAITFTGTYSETVFRDPLNIFGAGDLTFVETFTNNGMDQVEKLTNGSITAPLTGFAPYSTAVGYVAGTGLIPGTSDETSNGVIGFDFQAGQGAGSIGPGVSVDTLFIMTSATNFVVGAFTATDSTPGTSRGFVPAAPVTTATPEPSSLILLGTGLIGAAGMARRRFRRS